MDINSFCKNNIVGSLSWINSSTKTFKDICIDNRTIFPEWSESYIYRNRNYDNKLIKPINGYAFHFSNKPELILQEDFVIIRQKTHAEIWVEPQVNGLYALDKTWQRQFYPSPNIYDVPSKCFNAIYRFYTPWVFDKDIEFDISGIDGSPFFIFNKTINFKKVSISDQFLEPSWVDFSIINSKEYMSSYENIDYGILEIGSPQFDIIIKDKKIVESLINEYKE